MAGVAFDNAELARQLEDMRERHRAISGVLRAVAHSAGIQPVLDEVVEACERMCKADYGALYLLEHARSAAVTSEARSPAHAKVGRADLATKGIS